MKDSTHFRAESVRPILTTPKTPTGGRFLYNYVRGVGVLFAAILATVLCPALISIGWHIGKGGRVLWLEKQFQLPLAWSASPPTIEQRNQLMLTRRSWFVFSSPGLNTLFISQANPKVELDDVKSAIAMNGQPISTFSRNLNGHNFDCLSQPKQQPRFSLRYIPQIDAYCQIDESGWTLDFIGGSMILDEALAIVAQDPPTASPL